MRRYTYAVVLVSMLLSSSAWAGETYEPGPELQESFDFNFERTHDRGLYLRGSAGLGYTATQVVPAAPGGEAGDQAGVGLTYGAHLGGFVSERFALHLSQWGQLGAERGFLSVGPGLTFYFAEDANHFLSVVAGATTLYDAAPDVGVFTEMGLATELELGTGWWVTPHSSLGVSLVGGATAFDLDRNQVAGQAWYAGARLTFALN